MARPAGLTDADRPYIGRLAQVLRSPSFADDISGVQSAATHPDRGPFLRSGEGAAELLVASIRRAPFSTNGTQAVEDLRDHLQATAPEGVQAHVTGIAGLAADQAAGVVESFDRTALEPRRPQTAGKD